MAKDWCKTQAAQDKQDSYCWFFDRKLPGDDNGAWHSSDLWYWFGTLDNCWRPFTEHDKMLSDKMTDYLCNFSKTGNPNGEGVIIGFLQMIDKTMYFVGEKMKFVWIV